MATPINTFNLNVPGTTISPMKKPDNYVTFKQIFIILSQFVISLSILFSFKVLQRFDDVSLMCDKRIASLKKLALKPPRPIQTVTPEPAVPLQPPGGAPHLLRRKPKVSVFHD